jgi:hypothetical protein
MSLNSSRMKIDTMKIIIPLVVLVLLFPGAFFAQKNDRKGLIKKIVGSWKLVSIEATRPNGDVIRDWGQNPTGLLVYDSNGNVTVQFMRDPRPISENGALTSDEKKTAFDGYYAYFGSYDFDVNAGTVTHHIKSSLRPFEVGVDYKRFYKLSGNKLTLATPPMRSAVAGSDGEQRVYKLIWERIK